MSLLNDKPGKYMPFATPLWLTDEAAYLVGDDGKPGAEVDLDGGTMKTKKSVKKSVTPRGREEVKPLEAATRVNEGTQLKRFRRKEVVRAIQVASVDVKAATLTDQDGVVWPIIDRRLLEWNAKPGDWFMVRPDGGLRLIAAAEFAATFEEVP